MQTVTAVDLFCGAGGTSTGLIQAAEEAGKKLELTAINHWPKAIQTHKANHIKARHLCEDIDHVKPRELFPEGRIQLLVASPECTHHSNARGGVPRSDQSRATAWRVVDWASAIYIDNILVENVPEFQSWGPLGVNGKPLKSMKGKTFRAFVTALESLNYRVEFRVLNAADYGDPTCRRRFFLIARKNRRRIYWPSPTHAETGYIAQSGKEIQSWVPARNIIDWTIPSQSIFDRKKPLAKKTLARIEYGLRKFGGEEFLVNFLGTGKVTSLSQPLGTVLANGKHHALCQPFITIMKGQSKAREVEKPLPTLTTKQHMYLCQPFLARFHGGKDAEKRVHGIESPLPTLDTSNRYGLIEPFLIDRNYSHSGPQRVRSLDRPAPTLTTRPGQALVEPAFLVGIDHKSAGDGYVRSLDRPAPTAVTQQNYVLIEPFLIKYFGNGKNAYSVNKPIGTLTTKERFALVEIFRDHPWLDIRLRMLQPKELATAMSFPENYEFVGNKGEIVKQIGNTVPGKLGKALCQSLIAA